MSHNPLMLGDEAKMAKGSIAAAGPGIRANDPWSSNAGRDRQLLSEEERARLSTISKIVHFKKRAEIYRQGHSARAVFSLVSGVVKAYRTAPDGSEQIIEFLFPDDLFGLPEEGRYTNSTRALTAVNAFEIPVAELRARLSQDAALEFHVICKLCQELRQAQQHSMLLTRKHAISKVSMFIRLLEKLQAARGERSAEIYLPMNRSDIGHYIGLSLEAVSRAFATLVERRIINCEDRKRLKIVDPKALQAISG
jgi:CRP-like cAMP-binding protein